MTAQRLYMAAWKYDAEGNRDISGVVWDPMTREPAGWEEYSFERWGNDVQDEETGTWSHRPFHWPRTDKVFLSRSSAQYRVDIISRWGGNAVVVECDPVWVPVEEANKRRENARIQMRIDKKQVELLRLKLSLND